MTAITRDPRSNDHANQGRPYLVVSGDSHAGPSLERQLRDYCPKEYLDEFDAFVKTFRSNPWALSGGGLRVSDNPYADALSPSERAAGLETLARIRENPGSNDADARLADMDADGVTSEVIFAGAMNHEILPWAGGFDAGMASVDGDHRVVGGHMWNEWLADFCSAAPERLLGVAQIPIWDVEEAIKEVKWAKEHGLRALNFPAPRPDYAPYNEEEVYDPFWAAVCDTGLPLVTHSASGERSGQTGRGGLMIWLSEVLWFSRRGLGQLIFGSVFDRFPTLKVAFVEQRGNWVVEHLRELDSAYRGVPVNAAMPLLGSPVDMPKRSPSEYWESNCMLAASFMAPYEAALRHEIGLGTVMWGSDYPHLEGTWPRTKLALRNTFAGIPEHEVRMILGDNGARFFDLDVDALQVVADKIGPKPEEVMVPLGPDEGPGYRGLAFREGGSFH